MDKGGTKAFAPIRGCMGARVIFIEWSWVEYILGWSWLNTSYGVVLADLTTMKKNVFDARMVGMNESKFILGEDDKSLENMLLIHENMFNLMHSILFNTVDV